MKRSNLRVKLIIPPPQRNSSLPDDTNVARLQEELIAVKLREAEALTGLKELRQQVRDLEDHWQVSASQRKSDPRVRSSWRLTTCCLWPASSGTHGRSLERQPKEEHIKRTAGRADEREAARSWGPGRAAREQAQAAGDGDPGQRSRQQFDHFSFIHAFIL